MIYDEQAPSQTFSGLLYWVSSIFISSFDLFVKSDASNHEIDSGLKCFIDEVSAEERTLNHLSTPLIIVGPVIILMTIELIEASLCCAYLAFHIHLHLAMY